MSGPSAPIAGHIGPPADEPGEPDRLTTGEYLDAAAAKLARQWPAIGQDMLAMLLDCFDAGYRAGAEDTRRQLAAQPDPPPTTGATP